MIDFQSVLAPYNPWWTSPQSAFGGIPTFRRPVFSTLLTDIKTVPQMLAITGPRRIGKSTLLKQLIRQLIEEGVQPDRLVYYSFDDPALANPQYKIEDLIDHLMKRTTEEEQPTLTYLFLDEIQKLDRWELYLKKYYDLKYPVRIVVSGSASSPIFRKTRESLLGRIKDYHLLPFSFREYVLYSVQDKPSHLAELEHISEQGKQAQGLIVEDPHIRAGDIMIPGLSGGLQQHLDESLKRYFLEGGFPEVWTLPNWVAKQDYLFDNQVNKVIYEDLVLAAEFRKPELLKRFYVSLLEKPGMEINVQSAASETGVKAAQIERYLPLLEMTDLIYHVSKFRSGPLRVRKGPMKFYLVDLALRNAVLRLGETLLSDASTLGLYAENLVFLALKKWRGTIQMDYYRDRDNEVDFIVHCGPNKYLPVEVKYQNSITSSDVVALRKFVQKFRVSSSPIVVTKRWSDFGERDSAFLLPLPLFLLLFD